MKTAYVAVLFLLSRIATLIFTSQKLFALSFLRHTTVGNSRKAPQKQCCKGSHRAVTWVALYLEIVDIYFQKKEGSQHVRAPEFIIRQVSVQRGMESNGQTSKTIMTNVTNVYIIQTHLPSVNPVLVAVAAGKKMKSDLCWCFSQKVTSVTVLLPHLLHTLSAARRRSGFFAGWKWWISYKLLEAKETICLFCLLGTCLDYVQTTIALVYFRDWISIIQPCYLCARRCFYF